MNQTPHHHSTQHQTTPYLILTITLLFTLLLAPTITATTPSLHPYQPATPTGPIIAYTNTTLYYTIYTTNPTAHWTITWGDTTITPPLTLTPGDDRITTTHTYTTPGTYTITLHYTDTNTTTLTSPPKTITIIRPNIIHTYHFTLNDTPYTLILTTNTTGILTSTTPPYTTFPIPFTPDTYLLDTNADGTYDTTFSRTTCALTPYTPPNQLTPTNALPLALATLIIGIITTIALLFKLGILYFEEIEITHTAL